MIARSAEAAALFEERLFEPDIARSHRGEPPEGVESGSRAGSGTRWGRSCERHSRATGSLGAERLGADVPLARLFRIPIRLEELLIKRDRSLIDQSLHSRQGATPTNGDGFGVGWYDEGDTPRLYRSVHPAWNDQNLRELAAGISSPLFLAHIRASTGTAIQETNTHPFRYGRRLWMHNGLIREFPRAST